MTRLPFASGILTPSGAIFVCARHRIYAARPPLNRYSCSCGWLAWSLVSRLQHLSTPELVPMPSHNRSIRFFWLMSQIGTWIRIGWAAIKARWFYPGVPFDTTRTGSGRWLCRLLIFSSIITNFPSTAFSKFLIFLSTVFSKQFTFVSTVFSKCDALFSIPPNHVFPAASLMSLRAPFQFVTKQLFAFFPFFVHYLVAIQPEAFDFRF